MLRIAWTVLLLAGIVPSARAQTTGVLGDWREPGGSVLRVFSCPDGVCMRVMVLRPKEPLRFNIHDPDPAKHTEPICKLQIGYGFHPEGPDVAKDGRVYDPESGHIYHAEMHREGDMLHLRGYILFPALGRTEKWKRVTDNYESCQ